MRKDQRQQLQLEAPDVRGVGRADKEVRVVSDKWLWMCQTDLHDVVKRYVLDVPSLPQKRNERPNSQSNVLGSAQV